jgi:DNA-binding response OmpR family regulator
MVRAALVVEDHPMVRRLTRVRLEQIGWKVSEAANALEGKTIFRSVRPQLVVLDVIMPEENGETSLDLLRTIHAESPGAIVNIVSSVISPEDRQKFISEGATSFISKPFLNGEEFEKLIVQSKTLFEELGESNEGSYDETPAKGGN